MWKELDHKLGEGDPQDVGVVASFGHMIPDNIIDRFTQGMLVVHPSLLPKYRGSCPIQHAILNNERETGVSVIEISKNKFDAGAILY
jgi:methionyl-tRNA formyltransferase